MSKPVTILGLEGPTMSGMKQNGSASCSDLPSGRCQPCIARCRRTATSNRHIIANAGRVVPRRCRGVDCRVPFNYLWEGTVEDRSDCSRWLTRLCWPPSSGLSGFACYRRTLGAPSRRTGRRLWWSSRHLPDCPFRNGLKRKPPHSRVETGPGTFHVWRCQPAKFYHWPQLVPLMHAEIKQTV